jgi:tetratricopeptide (TPR) repeat protein
MSEAVLCPSCRAKINVPHDRCPRCRARLRPDLETTARHSKQLARWSAAIAAVFVLGIGGLWLLKDDEPATVTNSKPVDPFASRRQPRPEATAPPSAAAKPAEPSTPFLEPSGAGANSYATGDYQSALEQYKAAIAKNPDDAESHSNLGQILVRLGKPAEAVPHFQKAISLIPDRWAYHFNLARALSVLGKWDESIASYRQAQQLFPNDYATTFNLALTLHKKGDDQAAVEEYKKAIAMSPTDASFHFALALSYERLQRASDAVAAYEEYLRLAPSAGDAEKVRARIAELTGSPAAGVQRPSNPGNPQTF